MSADNWAVCPKCKDAEDKKRDELFTQAENAYGKVVSEKYIEMVENANKYENDAESSPTLREDYEIRITDDGQFCVSYRSICHKCGFKFSFNHKDKVYPETK
jgi:hypothetical protein